MEKTLKIALTEARDNGYQQGYADAWKEIDREVMTQPSFRLAQHIAEFMNEVLRGDDRGRIK